METALCVYGSAHTVVGAMSKTFFSLHLLLVPPAVPPPKRGGETRDGGDCGRSVHKFILHGRGQTNVHIKETHGAAVWTWWALLHADPSMIPNKPKYCALTKTLLFPNHYLVSIGRLTIAKRVGERVD